jgi:adenylylsulfate kinase-like enzyme
VAVCEARDSKGLYGNARKGQILNFTWVDQVYEAPRFPEMRFDTSIQGVEDVVDAIIVELSLRGNVERV